jgi:hypothetical protein
MPNLRRTSAGMEIWFWEVTVDVAERMHYPW